MRTKGGDEEALPRAYPETLARRKDDREPRRWERQKRKRPSRDEEKADFNRLLESSAEWTLKELKDKASGAFVSPHEDYQRAHDMLRQKIETAPFDGHKDLASWLGDKLLGSFDEADRPNLPEPEREKIRNHIVYLVEFSKHRFYDVDGRYGAGVQRALWLKRGAVDVGPI
jgi:hypothetical protein